MFGPGLFNDDFVFVDTVAGGVNFEWAEAVRWECVGSVWVGGEGGGFGGEGPGAVVEGFVHDGGEPEVTGFAGWGVAFVFAVAEGLEGLLEEGDLVHMGWIMVAVVDGGVCLRC